MRYVRLWGEHKGNLEGCARRQSIRMIKSRRKRGKIKQRIFGKVLKQENGASGTRRRTCGVRNHEGLTVDVWISFGLQQQ